MENVGYNAKVHGKEIKHEKFGNPHSNREGHEVFKNEKMHSSTDELHEKHYAHIK